MSHEYLNPRPQFRVSYWWQDGSEMKHETRVVMTQDTGHLHLYIPEEHARNLRGDITVVRNRKAVRRE